MMLYCIIVYKFNSTSKWFLEAQTSGNRLVPDLGCIADVSELRTHLGNFLCGLMSLPKGHIILLKDDILLKPISCVGIHLADTLLYVRCSWIIFLAETTLRLSCSLMYLSSRTLLMSAVIAVCGMAMWTSSPSDWQPSQKRAHNSNIHEVSMKLIHPWTWLTDWVRLNVIVEHCSKSVMNFSIENTFCHKKFNYYLWLLLQTYIVCWEFGKQWRDNINPRYAKYTRLIDWLSKA